MSDIIEYAFMKEHISQEMTDSYCMRKFREWFSPVEEPKPETVNVNMELFKKVTSNLSKVEYVKKFEMPIREPEPEKVLEVQVVDSADFRIFKEKRQLFNAAFQEYKNKREFAIQQTHYVNRFPLFAEIKRVNAKITNYEKGELLKVPSKVRGEKKEMYEAFYKEQGLKTAEFLKGQLKTLETLASEDKVLSLEIEKMKVAKKEVREARTTLNNKGRFFKKYQLVDSGKLLKTCAVSLNGEFAFISLSVRVSST